MLKSTKKILEELYEVSPSLKGDEQKLKSLIIFLEQHNPKVVASKQFREKLGRKLTTIGEFKQIQPKTKGNFMSFMRPLFLMVFGVFVLLQFHNFLSLDQIDITKLPSPDSQNFIIEPEEKKTKGQEQAEVVEENQTISEDTDDTIKKPQIEGEGEVGKKTGNTFPKNTVETETPVIETPQETTESNIEGISNESQTQQKTQTPSEIEEIIEDNNYDIKQDSIESNGGMDRSSENQFDSDFSNILPVGDTFLSDTQNELNDDNLGEGTENSDDSDVLDFSSLENGETIFGEYYSCSNGQLNIEDAVHQRKIIKAYCELQGGEILNDANVEYYLCKLYPRKEVGIEYIERDLCQ